MGRRVLLTAWLLLWFAASVRGEEVQARRVLVIHSYGRDMSWTEDVHRGIQDFFAAQDPTLELRAEYLDTKHWTGSPYLDELGGLLRRKLRGVRLDGILLSDNNALDFFLRYLEPLFSQTPVVAVGINGPVNPRLPAHIRILPEATDLPKTLDLALRANPQAERVHYLHDGTESGRLLAEEARPFLENLRGARGTAREFRSLREAERFLRGLGSRDVVVLSTFFRDQEQGRGVTPREVAQVLSRASPVPVWSCWTIYLPFGVVGGYMLDPRKVGEQGARLLDLTWRGVLPAERLQPSATGGYYADYRVLRRFGLELHQWPADTRVLGRPPSFYERHRPVLLGAGAVVLLLLGVIVLLAAALRAKNRTLTQRRQMEKLQEEIRAVQEETIDLLGEAIEGRSRETANHVRRVAETAAFLGRGLGLPEQEVLLLRRVAPLHDVGKIAVPDAILCKPGRLDPREFEQVKRHAALGEELLSRSPRESLSAAAIIAGQHHERWDGAGYPRGLRGEEIHLYGRIVAVADVFDALANRRCYKEAWPTSRVVESFRDERGRQFDPLLVDLLLEGMEEVLSIQARFPDR